MPNGRELVYRTDDQQLMIVAYSVKNGSFVAERPRSWTARTLADTGVLSNFDVDPTGGRVLALMPADSRHQQSPNHVTIRLHAANEVRRRLADTSPAR
jgi:hypothetical protein